MLCRPSLIKNRNVSYKSVNKEGKYSYKEICVFTGKEFESSRLGGVLTSSPSYESDSTMKVWVIWDHVAACKGHCRGFRQYQALIGVVDGLFGSCVGVCCMSSKPLFLLCHFLIIPISPLVITTHSQSCFQHFRGLVMDVYLLKCCA